LNISKRLTKAELARALGVSRSAVTRAVQKGRVTPGPDGLFDLEKARWEWRSKTRQRLPRDENYESWRRLRLAYQARLAELNYRQMTGELLPKADVDFCLRDVGTTLRVLIEGIADRLAPELAPLTDEAEIKAIVRREVARVIADHEAHVARVRNELERGTS
jgi:transcriptional regulator with XRE-family HTH domain